MAGEAGVQTFVHALESRGAKLIRGALVVAAVAAVFLIFILGQFRGLPVADAMDHAQIGREIARGNGFTTKVIRPAALTLLQENEKEVRVKNLPEIYQAPLNPLFNAVLLSVGKGALEEQFEAVYKADRLIAAASMVLFLIAVLINFFIAGRLFDQRLAWLGVGLVLVCDVLWQFSRSGLPHMLMLLIFSGCNYCLLRATEARMDERSPLLWSILAAALFGLLALAHGLTIWLFIGALIYSAIFLRPRVLTVAAMIVVFLLLYSPWLIRTYNVSGTPFGLAIYSALIDIKGSETAIMRAETLEFYDVPAGAFRAKIQSELIEQVSKLFGYLGMSIVAPIFFLSLLHVFKRPATSAFRWCMLLMWMFGALGMAVFGLADTWLDMNNLHVLFIPVMIFYGLAFVLVLWARLEIQAAALRGAFLVLIFLISALPLVNSLLAGRVQAKVHWPPYMPPMITFFKKWTSENEIIASDMPWAVAWYADRHSMYLPKTPQDLVKLNDFRTLGMPVAGIYLTPVSANRPFLSNIAKGEYREWATFVTHGTPPPGFAFSTAVQLPLDNETVFYADRQRWETPEQQR